MASEIYDPNKPEEQVTGWYNERCHQSPDQNVNRWRCGHCNLIHFYCVRCHAFKTIPDTWTEVSLWTLNKRMQFLKADGWVCDSCWFGIREAIRRVPKPERKIIVTE